MLIAVPQIIATNKKLNDLKTMRGYVAAVPKPVPPKAAPPPPQPAAVVAKPAPVRAVANSAGYGIAAGSSLPGLSAADLARSIADMKALGVGWVRFDIEWSNVQPDSAAGYNWAPYDRVVQALSAAGLQSLPIIDYTPAWARRADCASTPKCAPADPGAYAAFAGAAASRYAHYGVHAWEIWNEPNTATFFQPAADPGAYTALLRAANGAIKQVQPAATVVTGGLAPAGNEDGNLSPPNFISGMYAAGAGGAFDAVGDHPYTYPFTAAYPNPYNAWGQMATIHGIMAAHGDGAKKVWITEDGAPTGGPGSLAASGMSASETGADHVTEALEADTLTAAATRSRALGWVGPFFWYSYRDAGTTSDTNENFFGLVRADYSRKPAYAAYQRVIGGG